MCEPAKLVGIGHDGTLFPIEKPSADSIRGLSLWGWIVSAKFTDEYKKNEDLYSEAFMANFNHQGMVLFMADRVACKSCGASS